MIGLDILNLILSIQDQRGHSVVNAALGTTIASAGLVRIPTLEFPVYSCETTSIQRKRTMVIMSPRLALIDHTESPSLCISPVVWAMVNDWFY